MAQWTRRSLEAGYSVSLRTFPSRLMRTIISGCRSPLNMALGVIQTSFGLSSQRALTLPPVGVIRPLAYSSLVTTRIWSRTSPVLAIAGAVGTGTAEAGGGTEAGSGEIGRASCRERV